MPSILRNVRKGKCIGSFSFKPCYKWNAFNTEDEKDKLLSRKGFKPCYKWNAFNTGYIDIKVNGVNIKF